MKTLSLSEAKMKLSALVDSVKDTDQEVVITKNGVPAAVLVSPDEFESWRETIAVRFDPALMDEIRSGRNNVALAHSTGSHRRSCPTLSSITQF